MNQIIQSYLDAHIKEYEIESYDQSTAFEPVSYTHLDVYKRQHRMRLRPRGGQAPRILVAGRSACRV